MFNLGRHVTPNNITKKANIELHETKGRKITEITANHIFLGIDRKGRQTAKNGGIIGNKYLLPLVITYLKVISNGDKWQ